jgi:PIN domain nuclease of toxin-antitoxin system
MTIKQSLNKLDFNTEVDELISLMEKDGLTLLYVLPEHLTTLKKLPHHHNDPFDRLLISQALCENFTIISGDKMFENYGVNLFWSKPS